MTFRIDDRPLTRLLASSMFAVYLLFCSPVAYRLSCVDKYFVDHGTIADMSSLHRLGHFLTPEEGYNNRSHSKARIFVVLENSKAEDEERARLAGCPASTALEWQSNDYASELQIAGKNAESSESSVDVVTVEAENAASFMTSAKTLARDMFQWFDNVLDKVSVPLPQTFETLYVVADIPSLSPRNAQATPVYFGPGRRAIVVIPCSAHGAAAKRILSDSSLLIEKVLSTDRARSGDVVMSSQYHLSISLIDAAPLDRVISRREDSNATQAAKLECEGKTSLGWSGEEAGRALRAFLSKISGVVPTTLDSQIVMFAKISNRVRKTTSQRQKNRTLPAFSYVTPQDLQASRSLLADEINLHSGMVSNLKAPLHMLLYAPPRKDQPLFVISPISQGVGSGEVHLDTLGEYDRYLGFSVPRFGGVVIWNSYNGGCELNRDALQAVSDLWVSQIRQLIGMGVDVRDGSTVFLPSDSGVADWELDSLVRSRFRYFVGRTLAALTALSKLSLDMSHMAVGKTVGMHVSTSLSELNQAQKELDEGDLVGALKHVSKAFDEARLAESDPSMTPLKYFPMEHLAAVYLPLIIPLVAPIFIGIKRGLAEYRASKP